MFSLSGSLEFDEDVKCLIIVLLSLVSPTKSPRKSPVKPAMVTSSFYGKKKPVYLTPLERKAIKECRPSPPPPPLPLPPSQVKKPVMKNKKKVTGGKKPRKVPAGCSKVRKTSVNNFTTHTKTIRLSKFDTRFVLSHFPVTSVLLVLLWLLYFII